MFTLGQRLVGGGHMTAAVLDLLQAVSAAGGLVRLEGDTLRLAAPEPLPDELRARLRQHKAEIVAMLSASEPIQRAVQIQPADHQIDWGLPPEISEGVRAILTAKGALRVPPNRWPQIQRDTHQLLERGWLHAALNLSWSTADLFGCDQRAPLAPAGPIRTGPAPRRP
jgi:TubC N-terminal docking domain